MLQKKGFQKKLGKRVLAMTMAGALAVGLSACGGGSSSSGSDSAGGDAGALTITNVSYDPTRELYQAYNEAFNGSSENILLLKNGVQIPPNDILEINPFSIWN